MRNVINKKSCEKYDGEPSARPFYEKSDFSISLDQQSGMF